jgi:hypothetical protein
MTRMIFIAAALALTVTLTAVSAQAQSIRTYVSISGSDSNSCSLTAPCRHFQAAANATVAGGEVDALDPGGYGSLTINRAITIEGEGWSYLAPPNNGAAITINAVSGNVVLRGVSLNGVGVGGATGIAFNSGTTLNIQNCVIRNFSENGVNFTPTSSTLSQLFVSNTLVSDNGADAIDVNPSGSGTTTGVLDHVWLQNNGQQGFAIGGASNAMTLTIGSSVIAGNTASGISVGAATGLELTVSDSTIANNGGSGIFSNAAMSGIMVTTTKIANNSVFGILASGSTTIWLTRSTLTGNTNASGTESSGSLLTFGDNAVAGNSNSNGAGASILYK